MTFAHPLWIAAALAGAALVVLLYRWSTRATAARTLRYSNLEFLIGATGAPAWPQWVFAAAWGVAGGLMLLALAGPRAHVSLPIHGGSVVLCVDTSGSMRATDVEPTRAQAALAALRAFVAQAPADTAIGVLAFSSDAQVLTQPVRDRDQLQAAIDAIPAPNGATAIGDALSLAQRILPPRGARAVVLITDGENNTGSDPLQAAQALGAAHVPLYTIGIGTNSGALIPGTLEAAGIDEEALRSYAAATGGVYSRADDAAALAQALARLGRSTSMRRALVDLSLPAAIAAGVLMVLTFFAGTLAGRYA